MPAPVFFITDSVLPEPSLPHRKFPFGFPGDDMAAAAPTQPVLKNRLMRPQRPE